MGETYTKYENKYMQGEIMKKDTASKLFIVPFHTLRLTNLLLLGGKLRRKLIIEFIIDITK